MEVETRLHGFEGFNIPDSTDETLVDSAGDPGEQISFTSVANDVLFQTLEAYQQQESNESPSSTNSDASSPSAPLLPPCRICGEKASGFHYGANTCEACKGFFRRSLARKELYKCTGLQGQGNCEIGVGKRNACGYCRYQKCLASGMSKSAIKTGRYTHKKKTQDIREVKRLQHQEKLKKEGKIVIETESREEELEKIIKHITNVHMQQTPHTPEFFEKLPQKEKEFLEQRELQQKMFGTMRPLPREEYMKIYQSTGIDIDGRREMIKHMIPCIEKAIKRFIAFAKALPGFKDLPIDDQIALIKASRLETWLIAAHKAFNRDHMLFTDVCGFTLDMTELCKLHREDHLESIFLIASKIKKLELTTEEECVLKGLCILQSGGRCEAGHVYNAHCFNFSAGLVTLGEFGTFALEEFNSFGHSGDFKHCRNDIIKKIQGLQLRYQERLLLGAAAVLAPAGRVDAWLIWKYRAVNLEKNIVTTPWGVTYHLEMMESCISSKDLMRLKKNVLKCVKSYCLEHEEVVLLGSLAILAADRCTLKEPEKVEEAQWLLIEALSHLLKKNHPEDKHLLAKCIMVLTELRTVSALHAKEEEKFTMDWSDKIEFPPLFYEIWST